MSMIGISRYIDLKSARPIYQSRETDIPVHESYPHALV